MPRTGLLNADFTGPRQRGPQITLQTGMLTDALSGLYQATGKTPQEQPKDFSYFKDIARAGEQVAGALSGIEQTRMKLAMENQRITDSKLAMEAETKLSEASQQLKIRLAEAGDNPDSWDKITQEFVSGIAVDTSAASPEAKNVIDQHFQRWQTQQVLGTQYNAVVKNQENFKNSAYARASKAIDQLDGKGMMEAYGALRDVGVLTDDEYEKSITDGIDKLASKEFEYAQRDIVQLINQDDPEGAADRLKSTQALRPNDMTYLWRMVNKARIDQRAKVDILTDPQVAIEELSKLEQGKDSSFSKYNLNPVQVQKYKDAAFERSYENSTQAASQAADDIAYGALVLPEQVDSDPRYKGLSPVKRQMVKDAITNSVPKNNDQEFIKYVQAAMNTPVVTDQNDPAYPIVQRQIADLKNRAMLRFDGGYQEQLKQIITDRFNGNNDAEAELLRDLSDSFANGVLGDFKVPYVEHGNRWEIDWNKLGGYSALVASGNVAAANYQFFTEGVTKSTVVPGTPLSPKDQARAALEDKTPGKLKPGMLVTDQAKYAKARAALFDAIQTVKQMGQQNRTMEEKRRYVDSIKNVVPLQPLSSNPAAPADSPEMRLQKATETFNSLFPTNGTD